jgi:hypothetical protein
MTSVTAPTQSSTRSMVTAAAPLITMGTAFFVRKALVKGYEASTGKPAPVIANREAPVLARILWSAGMAAMLASIEIMVAKVLDPGDEGA